MKTAILFPTESIGVLDTDFIIKLLTNKDWVQLADITNTYNFAKNKTISNTRMKSALKTMSKTYDLLIKKGTSLYSHHISTFYKINKP